MLTYWKFKQIYKQTPYWKYAWNSFKSWFHGIINIPRATYLCIKYPFLYPRNRFNDLHYNNWKIQNCYNNLAEKYKIVDKVERYTYLQESTMLLTIVLYLLIGKI